MEYLESRSALLLQENLFFINGQLINLVLTFTMLTIEGNWKTVFMVQSTSPRQQMNLGLLI